MNDEQRIRATAWAQLFSDAQATALVLDDMTTFANLLPESQQAGACKLLLYILAKRGQLRRERTRAKGKAT